MTNSSIPNSSISGWIPYHLQTIAIAKVEFIEYNYKQLVGAAISYKNHVRIGDMYFLPILPGFEAFFTLQELGRAVDSLPI